MSRRYKEFLNRICEAFDGGSYDLLSELYGEVIVSTNIGLLSSVEYEHLVSLLES